MRQVTNFFKIKFQAFIVFLSLFFFFYFICKRVYVFEKDGLFLHRRQK